VDLAKSGGQEVRVGEVFVECAEKTGFPGFGFFLQGNNYALRGRRRLPEGKMQLTGSKDGGWEYTDRAGESKMEISAERRSRMRWLWLPGGLLILLILAAAVGAMLPVRHRATRRARLHQSPEALYAILAGPPDWRSDVKGHGPLPDVDGRKQWWEQDAHGQKIRFELVEDSPPVWRVVRIADRDLPFGGTWTFDISPAPEGAELRITEDGEVRNVFFRFMARFVIGHTHSIETFFKDLGARTGERVTAED
jgi:hypothetical protein